MAKRKKLNIGHRNHNNNRIRNIGTEANRAEKKMEKLLKLFKDGRLRSSGDKIRKIQGMEKGSKRHQSLQGYVKSLRDKI
jgi:hypothetical protein